MRIKYRYGALQRVTAPMAQNQEVSFYRRGMEALSTQAMTYVTHNDITDLNVTRNTSQPFVDRFQFSSDGDYPLKSQ